MAEIGIPSVRGVTDALQVYGVGAIGGVTYRIASQFFGTELIGGAVSAALAGSVVKGATGDMIAAMAGFNSGVGFDLLGVVGMGGGGGDDEEDNVT